MANDVTMDIRQNGSILKLMESDQQRYYGHTVFRGLISDIAVKEIFVKSIFVMKAASSETSKGFARLIKINWEIFTKIKL